MVRGSNAPVSWLPKFANVTRVLPTRRDRAFAIRAMLGLDASLAYSRRASCRLLSSNICMIVGLSGLSRSTTSDAGSAKGLVNALGSVANNKAVSSK